ncbi:MAG: DUF4783 domain-containing protein [Sediminibacterium sp.]|jgi:hypothetical protein|nr:DUF4783 domain-containing protein [Sediminibacterium sp.]MBP6145080.1 DUF4783 domain-containing protein [Sediminibacterium sp.]
MKLISKIVVVFALLHASIGVQAQNETELLVQHLQTGNFSALQSYWDNQVESSILDQVSTKPLTAQQANETLQTFFNQKSIVGFEKSAERKLGNTLYLTGKLLSSQQKFNLTLLLQSTKKGFVIVSMRVN